MSVEHIHKLLERVICIEDQFAEIDLREVEDHGTTEDVVELCGDLVSMNADVADENVVMPGLYELEDFGY